MTDAPSTLTISTHWSFSKWSASDMARQLSPLIFTTPGARGAMVCVTSAFWPMSASTLEACGFGVNRNFAKGIIKGVSATEVTAKTTQGSQTTLEKKSAATEAPSAPKAMHTKKKCVGGGRISRITNATQAINQYL